MGDWFIYMSYVFFLCLCVSSLFFFFFSSRRRHTRCSRDWFRRVLFRSNLDILERTELVADLLNRFGQPQVRAKECHVDLFEPPDAVIRKALALEPDRVHPEQPGAIPDRKSVV